MPLAPPVTTATLPASSNSILSPLPTFEEQPIHSTWGSVKCLVYGLRAVNRRTTWASHLDNAVLSSDVVSCYAKTDWRTQPYCH